MMNEMSRTLDTYTVPMDLMMMMMNETTTTTMGIIHDENEENTNHTSSSSSSLLMDDYDKVRDTYLQRKLVQSILAHVTTTPVDSTVNNNNNNIPPPPPPPNHLETEQLKEQEQGVLSMITNSALLIQQKRYELRHKVQHFEQRRDEFRRLHQEDLLRQQEQEQSATNDDDDDDDENTNFDTTMEYEQSRLTQEMTLQQLHSRRAELHIQYQSMQQRYQDAAAAAAAQAAAKRTQSPPDKEHHQWQQQLQRTNEELQTKCHEMQDIKDFYCNLIVLLEELYGIQFIRTTKMTTTTVPSSSSSFQQQQYANSNSSSSSQSNDLLVVTVQFLKQYTVDVTLEMIPAAASSSSAAAGVMNRNNINNNHRVGTGCSIQSAILTSDNTMVSGRPILRSSSSSSSSNDNEMAQAQTVVQLRVPNFNDIVQYVNTTYSGNSSYSTSTTTTTGDNIRVLLREILFRITMIEERVRMFTQLQQEPGVVATIGPLAVSTMTTTNTSTSGGGTTTVPQQLLDQEVICSLNDPPMTLVLRCTGNCPVLDHCIYLEELHGIGSGWDVTIVQEIQQRINRRMNNTATTTVTNNNNNVGGGDDDHKRHYTDTQYAITTPIDIIHAVQAEVRRLVDEQVLLMVPGTPPRIPIRGTNATTTTTTTTSTSMMTE